MKQVFLTLSGIIFFIFFTSGAHAQDLSGLSQVAHYTLIDTPDDALNMQDPMELINAPFAGADGVYSNGNYIGGEPDSCYVATPPLDALYDTSFAVQLEFKLEVLDQKLRAVIICGSSWRYLGLMIRPDSLFALVVNDSRYAVNDLIPRENEWYTLVIVHHQADSLSEFYLDGNLIGSFSQPLVRSGTDKRISNTHGGNGVTFKGYWRNLKVYGAEVVSALPHSQLSNQEMHVYPNPVSSSFRLESPDVSAIEWTIYDLEGQPLLTGPVTANHQDIDVSAISAGYYVLYLFDKNGNPIGRKRMIKMDGRN